MLIDSPTITGSLIISGSVTSTGGFTGSLSGTASFSTSASYAPQSSGSFGGTWDGQGGVISTTKTFSVIVPYPGTIRSWYLSTEGVSGSCVVDIKRSGTSIIGAGNAPTMSLQTSASANVSGWTSTAITANDKFTFSLTSATSLTDLYVLIVVAKP